MICFAQILFAETNSIHFYEKPENVTIYRKGADISMSIKAKLPKGTTKLIIDSLPESLDQDKIRINTKSNVQIMLYNYILEEKPKVYNAQTGLSPYKAIIDSLIIKKDELNDKTYVFNNEENLITSFKLERSNEKSATVNDLITLSNFYAKRLNEIKKEKQILNLKLREISKKIAFYENLITEENVSPQRPVKNNYQIIIEVNSEAITSSEFNITYYTDEASWVPYYDLNVNKINSPAILSFKAKVTQSTGEDWENIKLTLSTRDPNKLNVLPVLNPWYLRIVQPILGYSAGVSKAGNGLSIKSMNTNEINSNDDRAEMVKEEPIFYEQKSFEAEVKMLSVDYTPTMSYNIPSDGIQHSVNINESEVKADYDYYAIPKLDKDAFLVAKITNWGDLNLQSGNINTYFENNFIGNTFVNTNSTEDTLIIALGRDKDVTISRDLMKDFSESKFFSSNGESSLGYEIKVRNNKKSSIKITIEDQIPISTNEKIEVKIEELDGANFVKEKGTIKWNLEIPSGKTVSKKFQFKINAPKDIKISK